MEIETVMSDTPEDLDDLPEGTRIYLVRLHDPGTGLIHSAATTLNPKELELIDEQAESREMAFADACLMAAAGRVAIKVMKIVSDPEKLETYHVTEISRRELNALVEQRDEARSTAAVS